MLLNSISNIFPKINWDKMVQLFFSVKKKGLVGPKTRKTNLNSKIWTQEH